MRKNLGKLLLTILAVLMLLTTISCEGTTYVGVGISGPYYGYPYGGRYGYPYGGTVWVGRHF